MELADRTLGTEIILGRRSKFCVKGARYVSHSRFNLAGQIGAFPFEFCPYLVGCLRDQLLEDVPGNIPSKAKGLRQDRIIFRAFYQMQKPKIRQPRAWVGGN